ncbi:uncharacterized protein PG998_005708 [Apiospora kogelbergensis]|uniref:uncharacterized protein n=1 Tax=Apiospora kogelbergensis TaxID=1337665 RepID=UPI00313228C2
MADVRVIKAMPEHVPAIRAMVQAAYAKYVERIGRPPAPMLADYEKMLAGNAQEREGETGSRSRASPESKRAGGRGQAALGSVIVALDPQCATALKINNLVVDPNSQGKGYGRVLMGFAEELARNRGLCKLTLFTNVMMWENIGLYAKLGFAETGRRVEDGYERVYFEKSLRPY